MENFKMIGWSRQENKWLPVSVYHQYYEKDHSGGVDIYIPMVLEVQLVNDEPVMFDVRTGTILVRRFTGLKDKNGIEIYERSVLRWGDKNYVVTWLPGGGLVAQTSRGEWFMLEVHLTQIEVIGDDYQNPELIKGMGL